VAPFIGETDKTSASDPQRRIFLAGSFAEATTTAGRRGSVMNCGASIKMAISPSPALARPTSGDNIDILMRRAPASTLLFCALASLAPAQPMPPSSAPPSSATADPFLWLEGADSPRALEWVKTQNARSLAVLENDPRYAELHREALAIATATDRVPSPDFLHGNVLTNFWQDSAHVRGLWRSTTLASYRTAVPDWQPLLDIDALSAAEHANWVFKGADPRWPDKRRALVYLSNGGKDAIEAREFDLNTRQFVPGGFHLPEGKQDISWVDADTLAIAREWEPGTLTESGYAFIVKLLKRGEPLASAREVFRGTPKDVGVSPVVLCDNATGRSWAGVHRDVSFFESETYLFLADGPKKLNLPPKVDVAGVLNGQLVFTSLQDWTPVPGGPSYRQGTLLSCGLGALARDPATPITVVFAPGPREAVSTVALAHASLVVTAYKNVQGEAMVFTAAAGGSWQRRKLDLPGNSSVDLVSASDDSDQAIFGVANFLTPSTLWLAELSTEGLEALKTAPARFDASRDVVEQFAATSPDGTQVPYFVVRPKHLAYDGSNPTLLYGYGGFQISLTPEYSGTLGKLWLERGGVYVLANIRGGGEFGPAWHEAGLKTHRQRVYDDFAAVGRDVIARRLTSPRRLGIEGGSNGGLLMGVEFTQHPELWHAVVIQVPLLDMLRFDQIGAGASWVAEYGSPHDPVEGAFLRTISPYHNLRPGLPYPEPLLVTSTKDDRVGPAHARKMAAKMESLGLPFLYYENTDGGHAASANLQEAAKRVSLEMTYLTRKLLD
jgi:prolyl oligopeptidase